MTSRGQLLEWLHGFDNHCSLLTQVGEPVTGSSARKVQKIEACCKGITGFSQELKAARAGAAGANQQLDFLDLIKSIAVDGAQERTKQGPVKKAHSAAKGTDDPDQQGQQLYMLDDETGTMRPVTMAHMATPKQGGKKGKGGKTGKAKKAQQAPAVAQPVAQQPQSTTDAPRGMCRSFSVDGHCPRWDEHGFCPFQHFGPDQIVRSTNGYWKPKQGAKSGLGSSALRGFHAEPREDPEGEDPEWAWETGSVGSQQSARSARSARSSASQRSALCEC